MKKILTISVLSIFFLASPVSADNNSDSSALRGVSPVVKPMVDSIKQQPTRAEIERKNSFRDNYQNRLKEIKRKNQTNRSKEKPKINQIKERRRLILNTFKEKYGDRLASTTDKMKERKGQLEGKKRERIKKHIEKIISNFNKTLGRISGITEKIESRIKVMEERGLDMTESNLLILEVPIKTEEAKEIIETINKAVENILDADDPKQAFSDIRELINSAKTNVKESHASLVDVIKSIKASVKTKINTENIQKEESDDGNDTSNTEENIEDEVNLE